LHAKANSNRTFKLVLDSVSDFFFFSKIDVELIQYQIPIIVFCEQKYKKYKKKYKKLKKYKKNRKIVFLALYAL